MESYTNKIREVLNKQIKDDNEVSGKLSYAMVTDNHLFLRFDDLRWACYYGYAFPEGGGSIELMGHSPEIYELKEACLIDNEEYDEYLKQSKINNEEEQRRQELATLKRLQEKYGTKDNQI